MNFVLSRIAHFLHNVNVNYKLITFTRHESELFRDAFPFFVKLHVDRLSLHDFIKTFIIYQICVFVMMVYCSLLRLKLRECNSQKCDVNFQKSLCNYSLIIPIARRRTI